MTPTLRKAANAVLFPAFADSRLSDSVRRFLDHGGCSILLGETRQEYLAREMSEARHANETLEDIINLTSLAGSYSDEMIVAVDQELGGICRMHSLVPPFPDVADLANITTSQFHLICLDIATHARKLGINCFLAPILDLVSGRNPWLEGRTFTLEPAELTRISRSFITGVQQAGVIACAKHFPGYGAIERDPATDGRARSDQPLSACRENINIFQEAIHHGVEMVMCGPAIVSALDPHQPAATSPLVIDILKSELGFTGVVLSDDLDAKATLLGRSLTETAIRSLNSGCDLLLVADEGDVLSRLGEAICRAVEQGVLPEERLLAAAASVRTLAARYRAN